MFPAAVHVGAAPEYLDYVLPFACSAHYQNEARLRLAIMIAPETVMLPAVAQGDLDLLITGCNGFEQEDLGCELIYHDRMFIVAAENHPLSGRGELMLS